MGKSVVSFMNACVTIEPTTKKSQQKASSKSSGNKLLQGLPNVDHIISPFPNDLSIACYPPGVSLSLRDKKKSKARSQFLPNDIA